MRSLKTVLRTAGGHAAAVQGPDEATVTSCLAPSGRSLSLTEADEVSKPYQP